MFGGYWFSGVHHQRASFWCTLNPVGMTTFAPAVGCSCVRLMAFYMGYLELDVELCGRVVPGCGVLVVRNIPGAESSVH